MAKSNRVGRSLKVHNHWARIQPPRPCSHGQARHPFSSPKEKSAKQSKGLVAIVAGAEDRLIETEQSAHLHRDIQHSTLRFVPDTGHMVHQTATGEIMTATDMVVAQYRKPVVVTSAA
jgi:pimeloyl-ACP methyl ester carboxylesterase